MLAKLRFPQPAPWNKIRALEDLSAGLFREAPREVRYMNSMPAGVYPDDKGVPTLWSAGHNTNNNGRSPTTPWLNLGAVTTLTAGRYLIYINSSTDNSAPATHTARVTIPEGVDVVLVPVVNGAVLKTGGTSQQRCFDIANNNSFIRLRRGPSNAVFRIDMVAMNAAGSNAGCFGTSPGSNPTGIYGIEIDGPHSYFDSTSVTFERHIIGFRVPTTYIESETMAASAGTPTIILKNGAKLVGENQYIRGVYIGHLGAGRLIVNGLDFGGTARIASSGASPIPRDLAGRGLLFVEQASAGATADIRNTYGEIVPAVGTTYAGIKVFDCAVTARNLAHKCRFIASSSVKPTWFGGYNVANTADVDGYYCEVTGTAETTSGVLFLAGDDGKNQPRLTLDNAATGTRTCTAEWAFFTAGDVGKTVLWPSGTGNFTIDAIVNPRRATVTVNETMSATSATAFRLASYSVHEYEWRIGNKLVGGELRNADSRAYPTTSATIHGLFAGGCVDFVIRNSQVRYAAPGVGLKDAERCKGIANVVRDAPVYTQQLTCKGAEDCEMSANTLYIQSAAAFKSGAFRNDSNDYALVSTGNLFANNTIHIDSASFDGKLLNQDAGSDAVYAGNRWLVTGGGAVPARFDYGGLTNRTFAQYQADIAPTDTDE